MKDKYTVAQLDVARFMGRWYEIARFDNRFEKGLSNVTADYFLRSDGKILVINSGFDKWRPRVVIGKAYQPAPINNPGRLKVSFFLWFYSDYYIFELGKDYEYAVIGSRSDKYLWILSRTPSLAEDRIAEINKNLCRRGYDSSLLSLTSQSRNIKNSKTAT